MRKYTLAVITFAALVLLACDFSRSLIELKEQLSSLSTDTPPPTLAPSPISRPAITATPRPTETLAPLPKPIVRLYTEARVMRVIDGDTIDVMIDGRIFKVRYIGINCPEINHPQKGAEPFGPEAKVRNAELVAGQTVKLEKDVSEKDQYGRLLRYVWVGDVMINEALVREGYAYSRHYPPDVKHQERLDDSQREAQENKRGVWGNKNRG